MAKCNEIISKMMWYDNDMMNIKVAMQILKKICTANTLFYSIILIIMHCEHYHWHNKNKGIIGDDMGII